MIRINLTEELAKEKFAAERRLRECIAAGVHEPDRSSCRNAWGAIGFYKPTKWKITKTEWRH